MGDPTPDTSPGQQAQLEARIAELEGEVNTYKNRYSGQQSVLQQAQEQAKKLEQQVGTLAEERETLAQQLEQASSGKTELEKKFQSTQERLAELEVAKQKMDLVREKYPALSRFDPDVLPGAQDPEQLDAALGAFNEAVSNIVSEQTEAYRQMLQSGAVPTPPAAQDGKGTGLGATVEEAAARLSELAGTDKYEDALAQYTKMLAGDESDKRYRLQEDGLDGDLGPGLVGSL